MEFIKHIKAFKKTEQVNKGWSGDNKYLAETPDGKKLLLRTADVSKYERKKNEFEIIQKILAAGVPVIEPVDFGLCDDGKRVYQLFNWINGEDAENTLLYLSETEQYIHGLEAGRFLREMHAFPPQDGLEDWEAHFNRKIDIKVQKYHECGLRFKGDEYVLAYIEKNRHLLKFRPQCFQHGDYHIGNMMFECGKLKIIDFDRYDFGDPWEEFNRIVWSVAVSPYFATGQVRGYFDGEAPNEFWELLALYISSNTLSSIYWAIPFGQTEIDTMFKQADDVLRWYDNMQCVVPTWYQNDFHLQYTDGVAYRLKEPFDFSFLKKYGKIFSVYDDQDSGNICFGTEDGDNKYFIKFAGAPTVRSSVSMVDAITNLKRTVPIYEGLAHPNLINLVNYEEIGSGFAMVFDWVDGYCMGRQYPLSRDKFTRLPQDVKLRIFSDILNFQLYVSKRGYAAIDFYDGSLIYDYNKEIIFICDIDFFEKMPYINKIGRMWGSSRFMSPEEFQIGAAIDEITNIYTMGATAFELFGGGKDRSFDKWNLGRALYNVAIKAVENKRYERQQSIEQLITEWDFARKIDKK